MHNSGTHHHNLSSSDNTNDATVRVWPGQADGAPVFRSMTELDLAGLTALIRQAAQGSAMAAD